MITRLRHFIGQLRRRFVLSKYGRFQGRFREDLSWSKAARLFPDRNDLHAYFHHHFVHLAPREIRQHREYFASHGRGFGEDAFHAFWWILLRERKPLRCVEIGVYRGQTLSLWGLCARLARFEIELHGISPFEPIGDSVSSYRDDVDYLRETQEAVTTFGGVEAHLIRASSESASGVQHLSDHKWDLIYIDGGHDYATVLHDYETSKDNLRPGGLLVMDDSSLQT